VSATTERYEGAGLTPLPLLLGGFILKLTKGDWRSLHWRIDPALRTPQSCQSRNLARFMLLIVLVRVTAHLTASPGRAMGWPTQPARPLQRRPYQTSSLGDHRSGAAGAGDGSALQPSRHHPLAPCGHCGCGRRACNRRDHQAGKRLGAITRQAHPLGMGSRE
jgi:hypothetical protein